MTDLSQLIERVEAATEGSRELDARIACYFDNRSIHEVVDNGVLGRHVLGRSNVAPHDICVVSWARHYTTSIDAALTLLPEGLEFEFTNLYGVAAVGMGINTESPCYARREDGNITLTLLAAILRARQTEGR